MFFNKNMISINDTLKYARPLFWYKFKSNIMSHEYYENSELQ